MSTSNSSNVVKAEQTDVSEELPYVIGAITVGGVALVAGFIWLFGLVFEVFGAGLRALSDGLQAFGQSVAAALPPIFGLLILALLIWLSWRFRKPLLALSDHCDEVLSRKIQEMRSLFKASKEDAFLPPQEHEAVFENGFDRYEAGRSRLNQSCEKAFAELEVLFRDDPEKLEEEKLMERQRVQRLLDQLLNQILQEEEEGWD